jgi:hypothetical protein
VSGPHTKKPTVPVGVPATSLPDTVAESVFGSPSATVLLLGEELVLDDAAPTVKHSAVVPSAEGK